MVLLTQQLHHRCSCNALTAKAFFAVEARNRAIWAWDKSCSLVSAPFKIG